MTSEAKKSKIKHKLFRVILLLVLQPTVTSFSFSISQLVIESQGNLETTPCSSGGNVEATQIMDALKAGVLQTLSSQSMGVAFFKAGKGKPTCFQWAVYQGTAGDPGAGNLIGTITPQVETQSVEKMVLSGTDYWTFREPYEPSMTNDINSISPPPQGMALFLVATTSLKISRFKNLGGYILCHPSCTTGACSGGAINECSSCSSHASVAGSTIHSSLSGRCLCPSGMLNAVGDACDSSGCTGGCAKCNSASPSECFSCLNTNDWSLSRGANGMGRCKWKDCHSSCKASECSGPGPNQCLECPNTTEWLLTGSPGECQRKCHSSCKATRCSGPGPNQCLECPNTTEWTFNSGTCTQKSGPPGGPGGAITCHAACHTCLGPTENECLICKDSNSLVLQKTAGSEAGPCVSCSDPSRRESPECSARVVSINLSALSINTPTTADSANSGTYEPAKAPIRVPNKGKQIIRFIFPDTIIQRITQLGSGFVFTEFMSVTISGAATPADYTFSGAVNDQGKTYDVTFDFKKDLGDILVVFEIIKSNYFLLNLPTTRRRTARRELQAMSAAAQQLLDQTPLLETGKISVKVRAINYSGSRLDGLEATGIAIRVYIYVSLTLLSLGLILVTLATKYDGRLLGSIFDYAFFIGFLVKIPYIPAGWTAYDLTFWDEVVRADTILMSNLIEEKEVRDRLQKKFLEYSLPVNTPNNATYYASGLILFLGAFLAVRKLSKTSRVGVVSRTIVGVMIALTLPGASFYSGISTFMYSFKQDLGWLKETIYYGSGAVTFFAALAFISFINLAGLKTKKSPKNNYQNKLQLQQEQTNEPQPAVIIDNNKNPTKTQDDNAVLTIPQKIAFMGINQEHQAPKKIISRQEKNNKNNNDRKQKVNNSKNNKKKFTLNNLIILRYTNMLFLIIPLQQQPEVMLALIIIVQLGVLLWSIIACCKNEFESALVSGLFLAFESMFTMFVGFLGLTLAINRKENSSSGYWFCTVPLILLTILMIVLKLCHLFVSALLECKRNTGREQKKVVLKTSIDML